MFLTFLTFFVALCLSAVAAFYSIVGLTAIFAAAVMPIILMGSILEIAKLVVTLWLHKYWSRCRMAMKLYLVPAVTILMLITSMGIFGFLSKAHLDQSMVSGDVLSRIAIYDEKIRISKENIDANRRALKQLDEAVDQIMGRSTTEAGADKAVAVRRNQQAERRRLLAEIETEQKKISTLNEQRAPIAAEVRKVEAEVGPIKYIAALIYDEATDANTLERAVRWVIITLVIVFDPLAVMMLLAASESLKWHRESKKIVAQPSQEPTSQPLKPDSRETMYYETGSRYPATEKDFDELQQELEKLRPKAIDPEPIVSENKIPAEEFLNETNPLVKDAMRRWKIDNPDKTIKEQKRLYETGEISSYPWEDYVDIDTVTYGPNLPTSAFKGMLFISTSTVPTKLYKFNGNKWIEVDKTLTDAYTYSKGYVDFLISAISSGNYDTDLLTDSERAQIENQLNQDKS